MLHHHRSKLRPIEGQCTPAYSRLFRHVDPKGIHTLHPETHQDHPQELDTD